MRNTTYRLLVFQWNIHVRGEIFLAFNLTSTNKKPFTTNFLKAKKINIGQVYAHNCLYVTLV